MSNTRFQIASNESLKMKIHLNILTLAIIGLLATSNGFIRNIYDEKKSFWISQRCLNGSRPIRKCCKRVPFWTQASLPNPSDCRTYFRCNMIKMELLPCPFNYHWSKFQKKCLKPRQAECKVQSPTENPTKSSPSSTQSTEYDKMLPKTEKLVLTTIETSKTKKITTDSPKTTEHNDSSRATSIATSKTSKKNPKTTAATTTPFAKSKTCHDGREDPFECCKKVPYWENFMMSYPTHKNIYIECDHEQPVLKQCRKGLEWSWTANRCVPHKKTKRHFCN